MNTENISKKQDLHESILESYKKSVEILDALYKQKNRGDSDGGV